MLNGNVAYLNFRISANHICERKNFFKLRKRFDPSVMESATVFRQKRQGNWVPGPGRPKGSKNTRTKVLGEAMTIAAARLSELLPDVKTLDAHSLLIAIYSDTDLPVAIRLEAARAALRVEKPALQATQLSGELTLSAGIASRLAAARRRITDGGQIIDAVVVGQHQDPDI